MKTPSVLAIVLMVPLGAAAQTVADSFQQLEDRRLLREGDTILITYAQDGGDDHAVARGTFLRLTGSAITVQVKSGRQMTIAERNVRRIVREREDLKDPVWNGAFIGAGVGLGFGLVGALACTSFARTYGDVCEAGEVATAVLLTSGIGFGVGAAIDASHGKTQTELVYLGAPPDTGSMTVSVFPIVSREKKGVRVTVTW